jgi:hypothetical protein
MGAAVVEDWLELQDDDSEMSEEAEEELRWLSALARGRAPTAEVNAAVRRARRRGWGWSPIALLLGELPADTRRRMS